MEVFYENKKKYNCRVHGKPYFKKTVTIDGKRRYFYGDGEKDCLNKIEEARQASYAGANLDYRRSKFGDVLRYWLYDVKRVDRDIKATTFTRYAGIFKEHIEPYPVASLPLYKVTPQTIQKFLVELDETYHKSTSTIEQTYKLIRQFSKWALAAGYISKDITLTVKLTGNRSKGKKQEVETFSEEERETLYKYMEETQYEYRELIRLAFATGMRQGELLGLKWEDISSQGITVSRSTGVVQHTDKNGNITRSREIWDCKTENSYRYIPIRPNIYAMLKQLKVKQMTMLFSKGINKPSEYVFTTNTGELIDQTNLGTSYRRLLKRAGIEHKKFHALRHTFATEAIRSGIEIKALQKLMGHADIDTTYIYVHVSNEDKVDAINAMGDWV